ncbi:SpoIIE family protein phosphatase [Leptolyngbya sp. 7M]|uniref:SpoIIE family protein phosphatase n=1 Tax=Leptolyngbya sp. 7M TaxID=2812896 RepID=UPI001B8B18C0|nr:SpoIIE family protein phosphatase [Leptolyngbya sp. 7M]QYO66127.1 SpoIIE family protein phosphatase [Leptolyngbya sp. 7M]
MARLLLKNSSGIPENIDLSRIRTTIGRSARSDVCIPDAFASRLHAEVRLEGDSYWLQDLGSANGTRHNGNVIKHAVPLMTGDEIQIGETTMVFDADILPIAGGATLIADRTEALDPSKTISFQSRRIPTTDLLKGQFSSRNDLLGLISKVGVALLSASGLEETLDQVASLVFEAVPAERCVIMLRDDKAADGMKIMVARIRGQKEQLSEVRISHSVMNEVLKNGKSVLTADAQQDPRFATQTVMLQGIRSVLAVPLSVDERNIFGLIYADSPTYETTFTEEHLNILTTLASVASIRVENATLLEERMQRERMERELELATEIQQRFQPSAPPIIEGYEFQGISFSCYEIGGDYYDFIKRPDGKLMIALGDVSGKGTAAALLMSSLHAAIHAQIAAKSSLWQTVMSVNEYLSENTPANRFVTLFIGELDPVTGKVRYINAGHNPPLLALADGSTQQLDSGGLPLGLMSVAQYEEGELSLESGDTLVVYSDGVSEAVNPLDEEFGMERLTEVIINNRTASAAGIRDKVESALSSFTQTAPANDDITLVIAKRI